MTIDIHTPLEDAKKRKEQIRLLQLVIECTDGDYIRAVTTIRRNEIPPIIAAKRSGLFDYGQLLVESEAGLRWPKADLVLAAIEKAGEGELTADSDEWKAIVAGLGDGITKTQSGTKIKDANHLFHLVTQFTLKEDGTRKTKPQRRKSSTTRKRSSAASRKVEKDAARAVEETQQKVDSSEPTPSESQSSMSTDDLMEALAGAFQALDSELSKKIDLSTQETSAHIDAAQSSTNQAIGDLFTAVQLVAKLGMAVYRRQEDLALDPMGDTTELTDDDLQALEALVSFDVEEIDDSEVKSEDQTGEDSKSGEDDPPESDGDVSVVTLSDDHVQMSDEEFAGAIENVDDIEVPDFEIISKFSTEKIRHLAVRVGVPNASTLNHRKLLLTRIQKALSHDE